MDLINYLFWSILLLPTAVNNVRDIKYCKLSLIQISQAVGFI